MGCGTITSYYGLLNHVAKADRLLLLLDYDGTLTPIAGTPEEAVLSGAMRQLLKKLAKHKKIHVGIVSGRGLENIKKLVRIPGLIYVGNHGFEAEGVEYEASGLNPAEMRPIIKELCREISRKLEDVKGALIEDKGLSASVHYRLVAKEEIGAVRERVAEVVVLHPRVRLAEGRKVLEIRPNIDWDKGRMAALILEKFSHEYPGENILPIYIGDDATDEDAFEAFKEGITVRVSKRDIETKAKFVLKDTDEVEDLLRAIRYRGRY